MVKATAACLQRVFFAACLHRVFLARKPNHGEGNGRLPSPCVFGTKAMVKATAACLQRVFLAPKPW